MIDWTPFIVNFLVVLAASYLGARTAIRRHAISQDDLQQLVTLLAQTQEYFDAIRAELRENGST